MRILAPVLAAATVLAAKPSSSSASSPSTTSIAVSSHDPTAALSSHLSPMEILSSEPISPSALHLAALADSDPSLPPSDSSLVLGGLTIPGTNLTILAPPPKRYTFTQGFLLGQFIFVLMCGAFIKYVVFEDAEAGRKRRAEREKKPPLSVTNVPPPSPGTLLDKVGYDMSTHGSESSDWVNVLFGQVLQGYRDDLLGSGGEEGARRTFEKWLNPANSTINWLDPITVTSLSLGSTYPLLSNARIRPADAQGNLRAEVDLDYTDSVHLSLATSVLVNFPRPRFAVLPVALGIELIGFEGTMTMQIHKTPSPDRERWQQIHLSLLPDFHLNVKASSLLGSRAKLQDIPKLEQIVISRLQAAIQERIVWPRFVGVGLPRLVSAGKEKVVPGGVVPGVEAEVHGGQDGKKAPAYDGVAKVVVNGKAFDHGGANGSSSRRRGETVNEHDSRSTTSSQPAQHPHQATSHGTGLASLSLGRDELFSPPLISAPGIVTSRQTSKFLPDNSRETPHGLSVGGLGAHNRNGPGSIAGPSQPGTPGPSVYRGLPIPLPTPNGLNTKPRSNTLPIPNSLAAVSTALPENSIYPNGSLDSGALPSPKPGAEVSRPGSSYGFPIMSGPGAGGNSRTGTGSGGSSVVGGVGGVNNTTRSFGPEDILRYRGRSGTAGSAGGGSGSLVGTPGSEAPNPTRTRGALNSRGREGVVR